VRGGSRVERDATLHRRREGVHDVLWDALRGVDAREILREALEVVQGDVRFGDGGERGRDEIGSEGGMSRARRAVFSRGGGEGEGEVAGGGGVVRGAEGRGGGVGDGGDRAEDVRPGGAGRADRAVARQASRRVRGGRAEVARTTPAASGRRRREIERRRDGDVRGVTGRLAPHVGGWRGRGRRAVRRERAPGARIRRERDARRSRERRVVDASRRR